jgi:uncharacterized protein (TIGR04255 family)
MKLPALISPCPLIEAVLDVRFETQVLSGAVFGYVYQLLRDKFPTAIELPGAVISSQHRALIPALMYQPQYRLENNDFAVLIGPQSLSIGMRGEYPGWLRLRPGFLETMTRIARSDLILRASRFGLRYINFFPQQDIFASLKLSVSKSGQQLKGDATFFRIALPEERGCKLLLQIGKDMVLPGPPSRVGSIIDIDAFADQPQTRTNFEESIKSFLETAHLAEKELFFDLLKPEFLQTLNPIYSDE